MDILEADDLFCPFCLAGCKQMKPCRWNVDYEALDGQEEMVYVMIVSGCVTPIKPILFKDKNDGSINVNRKIRCI